MLLQHALAATQMPLLTGGSFFVHGNDSASLAVIHRARLASLPPRTGGSNDVDVGLQEAVAQQEKELAEERKRQTNILDEQRNILQSLEEMMKKRGSALAKTKEEVSGKIGRVGTKVSIAEACIIRGHNNQQLKRKLSVVHVIVQVAKCMGLIDTKCMTATQPHLCWCVP